MSGTSRFQRLNRYERDLILSRLLADKFSSEFKVIDGISQHKDGYNFDQWLDNFLSCQEPEN